MLLTRFFTGRLYGQYRIHGGHGSRDGDDEVMIGGRECGEQKERGSGR